MSGASNRRVALFLPSLRAGGAEHVMLELGAGFARRGLAVDLVVAEAVGEYLARVPASVQLVGLGARRTAGALPALVRYLRRERPGVLLSTMNHVNVVATAAARLARTGTRVVLREATTPNAQMANARGFRAAMVPSTMAVAYRAADVIVAVCAAAADSTAALTHIPRGRIHVIGNPVEVDALTRRALQPTGHPWLDRPDGTPVVLGIGRLSPEKDFPMLIRAFCRVLSARPARLILAGEGYERRLLEGLVRSLGIEHAVSLRGFVSNPSAFLGKADVFALASRWEGLPNVLLHALALGVPAVATDSAGGASEVLGHGSRGALVPVGDDRRMAEELLRAIESPRPPSHASFVRENYGTDLIVDRYLEVMGLAEEKAA